jgi:hypothetical protein
MNNSYGWWTLQIDGIEELTDEDREHIAECIKNGYTEGEIIQEDEYDKPNCQQEED